MLSKYHQPLTHLNQKFDAHGNVLRFPGNTLICHLPLFTPLSNALTAVRDRIKAAPHADCLAMLPPESYHMTVFEGVNDQNRTRERWPEELPLNVTLAECTRHMANKLQTFDLGIDLPLRMKLAEPAEQLMIGAMSLVPADAEEAHKLRDLRDRLATHLGFRTPWHDSYTFHMTHSYLIQSMSLEAIKQALALQSELYAEWVAPAGTITLGAPEFCTFIDMQAFDNLFFLRRQERPA
ncbi:DUF1868 domain-containing protein [Dyella acidisoli]|uniref:DUF1868 domain-containing protein n=1 Tax=Dyella acidisoli TaxID=1867834 RepID=A0ABQ5XIV9_9GAMM|nr:DUF1868 domain-containing protein [Dyella acidisoli]GLQ91619.1 hypothetical protein GCM10007901_05690 [Dyella acidisoli]